MTEFVHSVLHLVFIISGLCYLLGSSLVCHCSAVRQYLLRVSNVLLAQDGMPNGALDRDNEQVSDDTCT